MRIGVCAAALLVALVALPVPATADSSVSVQYMLPAALSYNGFHAQSPVGVQPCLDGCPVVGATAIGSPVYVLQETAHEVGIFLFDDEWGTNVAVGACLDKVADNLCANGLWVEPSCGHIVFWATPSPAETHVHAYHMHVDEVGNVCGASQGTAILHWD